MVLFKMSKKENEQYSSDDMPHIAINSQYIKDLSFENPNPLKSLTQREDAPNVDLSLDLNISNLPEKGYYEVELTIEAKASTKKDTLFLTELKYAGIFHLINIPEEQKEVLLAVHCPAMIFPFAR